MKKVHFTLQGKGGVGKSYVSSLLAQFHRERGEEAACIDTDPVNATFSGYKAFDVRRIELMNGSQLNERQFDAMMEQILSEDRHFVIDTRIAEIADKDRCTPTPVRKVFDEIATTLGWVSKAPSS